MEPDRRQRCRSLCSTYSATKPSTTKPIARLNQNLQLTSQPTYRSPPMPLNQYSAHVTQPKSQGASQAMLFGTGLTPEDMQKPQVGIASVWYEGNTCNMHLNDLSAKVKEGVKAAGLVGMRFNTIGVSDGISMGT